MSEWKKLSDLVERKICYGIVQPGNKAGNVPIIKVNNIIAGLNTVENLETTTEEIASKYERTKLKGGELIISLVGTVGVTAIVPHSFTGCNLVRATGMIDIVDDVLAKYVKYYLETKSAKEFLYGRLNTTVQPTLNVKTLENLPIPIIDRKKIIAITSILSSLDDKIAVNRRICENLEAQAQALFKHWFIDFAPFKNGKFVESELGMIPEGWRVMSIDDIYSIKYGKNLPTSKIKEKGDYPVYGANGIMGYYNTYNYDNYVTLITSRGSGSGDVSRTFQEKAFITNNSFAVNPKDNYSYLGCGYTYYCIKNINFKPFCSGSAQPQLTNTSISAISILLPDKNVVIKYNSLASYIQKEINQAYIESNRLATLRDTLLPKLMSGQIKV